MKNIQYFIGVWVMLIAMSSCRNDILKPLNKGHGAPGPVSNVQVKNLPGAAEISYSLPDNVDLLYVKAEYKTGQVMREARASYYNNSLLVNGFGSAGEYKVALYAVNSAEQVSKPVIVKVNPQTPPVLNIYKSLSTNAIFGGLGIHYTNATGADISIHVITPDSTGDWITAGLLYTKSNGGIFNIRGYKPVKRKFGVYIKDHWGNISDTLISEITPIEEVELDKSKFSIFQLPGDMGPDGAWTLDHLWDGQISGTGWATKPYSYTDPNETEFTFCLGVKAKLSRFKIWPRYLNAGYFYGSNTPRVWEMWGSDNPDPTDGSYKGWTKLMTCTMVKPSGLPSGQNTNEDIEQVKAGFEFTFPQNAPPVKYIRFRLVHSWIGSRIVQLKEITIWGKVIN